MVLPAMSGRALSDSATASPSDRWVHLIDIDGSINPAAADFIDDAIAKARSGDARALVIRLDDKMIAHLAAVAAAAPPPPPAPI